MRRTTLLTIVLVIASAAAIPVVGMAATGSDDVSPQTNDATEQNATVAPGERLSGVVGVQGAELEGEIDSRAFGLQVARAATNDSKADVVAEKLGDLESRLAELEQRKEELDEARENGSMGEGEYRARVTEIAAQTETVQRLTNQTNETANGLPAELLESKGINVTAIQTLKNDARNLSGQEVAEIARSIAGEGVGKAPGTVPGDRPDDVGPPDDAGPGQSGDDNATERSGDGDKSTDSGGESGTDTPTETGDESDTGGDGSSDRGNGSQAGQSGSGNGGR